MVLSSLDRVLWWTPSASLCEHLSLLVSTFYAVRADKIIEHIFYVLFNIFLQYFH